MTTLIFSALLIFSTQAKHDCNKLYSQIISIDDKYDYSESDGQETSAVEICSLIPITTKSPCSEYLNNCEVK